MMDGKTQTVFLPFSADYMPAVLLLETDSYPEPWTHGMYRQELENPLSHMVVALRDGMLMGYAGFWLVLDEAHVTRVTIAPEMRGQGHGRALMEHLLKMAFDLGASLVRLEVRETNETARNLYQSLGFVEEGRRFGYYKNGSEDAVLMVFRF